LIGEPDVVGTFAGYECRYTPTVMDGPVFRWSRDHRRVSFEVSASRTGVMVHGPSPVLNSEGIARLVQLLSLAEDVYLILCNDDRAVDAAKRGIRAAAG
jgi:hypothetical protein